MAKQGSSRWEPTALGRFVRRQRRELELSQEDLAKRLDIHHTYVSQIERGRLPDLDAPDFIGRWARALEVDPETFVVEAELWRYNLVQPRERELSPARSFLLAITEHLSDDVVYRIARGVREQYGEPPPKQEPEEDHQGSQPTSAPS